MSEFIVCPNCSEKIPLSKALTQQIEKGLRRSIESEMEKKHAGEVAELEKKYASERAKLEREAEKKAQERLGLEMKDLQEQVQEKEELLEKAQQSEMELRKKSREIEERERNLKLELDREREAIRKEAQAAANEEYRLKERQNNEEMAGMRRQIEELKRRAEQGSQQAQGEALELELEDQLKAQFPHDDIDPVGKGKQGADVLQTVRDSRGQACGIIIWESKRTKGWNKDWIPKLKDDMRAAKADVAVIVSTVMPKDYDGMGQQDGVWLTGFSTCVGMAAALRQGLIDTARARSAQEGKSGKMELLYDYIAGPEFRQRVEAIVEPFQEMRNDLYKEQEAMRRLWAKREKQIERVLTGASGMYGDLEGIAGASLPGVRALALPGADVDEELDELEQEALLELE